MQWWSSARIVFAALAAILAVAGCQTQPRVPELVVIRYQQPLNFTAYHERAGLPPEQAAAGGVFAAFKVLSIQNGLDVPFNFDPAKLRLGAQEGKPSPFGSAQQVGYATRPAKPVLVPAGQIASLAGAGANVIFKVGARSGSGDLRYERFALSYADAEKRVLLQPTPTSDTEYQPVVERNDLAQRGL